MLQSISYNAKTELAQIKVEIFRKQCIDAKSNRETKYEVRIKAKRSSDKELKIFKGCGKFYADKKIGG
jgi:hypothetical protein